MTDPANSDLGGRLRLLAPPIEPPADVMVSLRPRIRRRQVMRAGVAALATAVVVASAVTIPGLFGGTGGPTRAQVQSLVAQGERPAVRYTGADIPEQLKNVPLWLVAERHAGTNTLALVAYTTGGHPCLGSIDTSRLQDQPITAFEGSCSRSDMIEALGDYQPFGQLDERGPDAVFYGTVPADVRIVEANTTSGTLAARFASTAAMPGDSKERFFIFDAPGGATHSLAVDLTFYDSSGQGIGSRHISLGAVMGASSGSEPPCTPANHCAQASTSAVPAAK